MRKTSEMVMKALRQANLETQEEIVKELCLPDNSVVNEWGFMDWVVLPMLLLGLMVLYPVMLVDFLVFGTKK